MRFAWPGSLQIITMNLSKVLANFSSQLAQIPSMQAENRTACRDLLASIKSENPRYSNILKVDLTGHIICDAISSGFSGQIPFDGFPQEIIESKSFTIGNYVISPTTHKPTIGFGYPLIDEKGDVIALLIARLDLGSLNDLFSDVQLPPSSTLTLRDRNKTITEPLIPNLRNGLG